MYDSSPPDDLSSGPGPDGTLDVLLVEDNPGDARLFEEYLGESSTEAALRHEETLQAGLGALKEERPDVLVVDLGLPDSEGVETVEAVATAAPEVPIVVLTGQEDLQAALDAQEAGAAEYLQKDELGPALVGRTLRWAVQRHRMQAKLRQRDAWIRSITEGLSAGVFRTGPTGRIEYANEALAEMLGAEAEEELVGLDLTTFYADPTDRGQMLAEEGADGVEVRFTKNDGSTFVGLLSARAVYDADARPVYYDGVITDITEQKETQRELKRSEELTRSVLDALAANVSVLDGDGTIIDVNEQWKAFGAENEGDPEKIGVGTNYLEVCSDSGDEDTSLVPPVEERLRAVIDGERDFFEHEYPCHSPEEKRWFLLRATPLEIEEGGAVVAHIDVTERVQAVRRQRILSEAVEQAKEAVLITEAEPLGEPGPRVEYVNSACEEMTGYSEEEMVGKTPRVLQGPDTERDVLDSLRAALEAGEEWEGETVNYRKDGTPYRVQWNVAPVIGEEGEIERWISVQRDVTEEREREQRLAQMAQALEQIDEKVFITDREGRIRYVNEAFEDITGYREDEVVGKTPAVLQSGEQDEAFYEEMWDTILSGETFRAEFVNEKKDGTRYVEDESISPVTNEEGEITRFVSAGRDVTERKEREEALRRHRNLLQQTQRLAGAWEVDLRSDDLSWSDEVYRIHEVEPGTEIEVEDGIEFYAPEARPRIREAFERCVEEGEPYDLELPLITANGNRRWVRTVGAPAQTENGEVVKVAGAFQDITDRKEAERELAESEERYRTLAEHFPNGAVGVYDHDLRYSLAEGELLGTRLPTSDELEGDRMPDIFPNPTASDLEPMFRAAVEEGVSGQRETTFNERIWRVWATPLRGPEGEIFAGLSYAQDITEHKQREQTLREQRNLLNQTQRLAGGWQVDLGSEKVSWSEEVYRIHELPPDTEIGLDEAIAFFEAGAVDELEEAFDRCIGEGEPYDLELPLVTAEGNRRWVRTVGAPSEWKNGETIKVAGAIQDITERKQAEEALKKREAQLRGLANSIPGVVYQFYALPDGTYGNHFVSDHAESLLGIAPEVDGFFERVVERIPPTHREKFLSSVDEAVEEEATWRHEFPYQHPSGETIWVLGTSTPERRDDELIFNGVLLDVTERREAQEALEEREEYLSVTLQSIGDAVVATDRDGCITEMNAVAEQLTGWSREEAEGKLLEDVLTLHSARTGEAVESPAEDVLRAGKPVRLGNQTVLTSREGTEYQVADSAAPIRSEEGDLLGVVLVFRDVTEKYEQRRRMERQNDLFEQAEEIANVGAWEYDVQAEEIELTDQAYRVHGLAPGSDMTPHRSHELFHPEDRPEADEAFRRAVKEGESYDLEARLITEEGEERWIRTRGEPQREEGEVVRVYGAIQDITERKNREMRLRLLAEALEQVGDKVVITDREGRIEFVNEAFEQVTGFDEEEVLGETPKVLQSGLHDDAFYRELWETILAGETFRAEIVNERKDGTTYVEDETISPVVDEDGDVTHFVSTGRDVTARKEREQELKEAKEEAERMNRLKSAFLANMSHEIRTPLTSILGFAEAIGGEIESLEKDSEVDLSTLAEFSSLIERSGQRLMDTLTGVLNLSKLEAGEMDLDLGPVDLTAEAEETAREFGPQAEDAGIDLVVEGGNTPVWARADDGGLQIALRNLLSNAIKYTESGGTVWLRVRQAGDVAALEVEDTGIGMDPETAQGLFEAFKQASEGVGREYEGTGLGLTVTREVLDQMGGSIEVETEKGEGSRFTVRLPRSENSGEA